MEAKDSLMSEAQISSNLQLFISCRNLPEIDMMSSTNSFVVVSLKQFHKPLRQVLKTKVYQNDHNPNYAQTAIIDFVFEVKQKLTFEVFQNSNSPKLIGKIQSSVGEIFGSPSHGLVKDLEDDSGKTQGKIIVRCEKFEKQKNKIVQLKFKATNLPNFKSWYFFGGTSAFFRIFRKRNSDQLLIYQSQTINKNTSPAWKSATINGRKLCKNNEKMKLEVRIYHFVNSGDHRLIGSSYFSLDQLRIKKSYDIQNNGNKNGVLLVDDLKINNIYQFQDFIQNGLQLALVTCVDFTASNGTDILEKSSLHYKDNKTKSQYQKALSEVSSILLDYDYDKLVPTFGFGARTRYPNLNSKKMVHHCFPLNGQQENPDCYKLEGIMEAYDYALAHLQFAGPTYFSGLLDKGIQQCRQYQKDNSKYMILFILTDGQIHDRNQVIDKLVQICDLPMSIIIVGIGNGQFEIMKQLDDDNCQLIDSKGKCTTRDLVQFVKFNDFNKNSMQLAKQVLFELPRQVAEYFQKRGVEPKDIPKYEIKTDIDIQKQMEQKQFAY